MDSSHSSLKSDIGELSLDSAIFLSPTSSSSSLLPLPFSPTHLQPGFCRIFGGILLRLAFSPSCLICLLPSQYKLDQVTPPLVSLLPESHQGFLAWLMKALLTDPWVSCPGVVSCHHRLCPLSSRVSSLHNDVSFIKNVIVTFHFCFTLSSLRSGIIIPLSRILSLCLLGLPDTWGLVPTLISHEWLCVYLWILCWTICSSRANTGCVCLIHLCPQPPAPWPWAPGLGTEWEIRK